MCPGNWSVCVGDSSLHSEEIVKISNCDFQCDHNHHHYHYFLLLNQSSCGFFNTDRLVGLVLSLCARLESGRSLVRILFAPGFFSGSSHASDLKIGTPVALPGAWRYRARAGTGRPGVSLLWLGEIESLICNVAARKIVQIRLCDTLVCCWDVKQPTNIFNTAQVTKLSYKRQGNPDRVKITVLAWRGFDPRVSSSREGSLCHKATEAVNRTEKETI